MRYVHILDPQLHGQGGHYMNHDAQLVRELQRRGIPVSVVARKGCSVQVSGVTPEPVFTQDIFQEAATDPHVWAIENFHNVNQAFLADLCRINPERFSADDLIYFPNLLQNQMYAVAMWLARLPQAKRPAVAIMLRYLNHAMDYVQARANKDVIALYYRYAARALYSAQPQSILCADTRELAAAYHQITGLPVVELPNPMDVSDLLKTDAAHAAAAERPMVVYQGHTSPLRGFHFLPEIIQRCKGLQPRPRFLIQVQNREAAINAGMGPVLEGLTRLAGDDVKLVNGSLSQESYFSMLKQADIVLLPYTPTFYGHGSSGVFTEAASVGKVVVVSKNTVPARQGAEYQLGVVAAAEWTASAMADAVASALKDLPALKAKAMQGAEKFRQDNCARVLWDQLFAAIHARRNASSAVAAA
jgi:glycosyltransferase involved in cell wall biosynthesis